MKIVPIPEVIDKGNVDTSVEPAVKYAPAPPSVEVPTGNEEITQEPVTATNKYAQMRQEISKVTHHQGGAVGICGKVISQLISAIEELDKRTQ